MSKKILVVDGNRSKGSGTLVLRGTVWHARWMVNGKLYTRSTKCTDKAEAEKKLAEFVKPFQEETKLEVLENLAAKVRVQEHRVEEARKEEAVEKQKPIKLEFLIDVYLNDLASNSVTDGTTLSYTGRFEALRESCKKTYAYEVTKDDAEAFLTDYKKRTGPTNYNHLLVLFQSTWKKAMKKDYRIKANIWEGFSKLKVEKAFSRRELTREEVESLFTAITTSKSVTHKSDIAFLFKLGRYTGLRISDCSSLKWSEIDFESNMIRKLPKKTKKTGRLAVVPLHPALKEELMKLEHTSEFVNPYLAKCSDLNYITHKVFSEAGIETSVKDENGKLHFITGFHSLRTTFVSECARDGIPLNVIQKMVGHSKVDMTMNYTRTQESDLRLPGFDEVKVALKKHTYEALVKAANGTSLDEFILKLVS